MTPDEHLAATVERAAQASAEAEKAIRDVSSFIARRERTKTLLHDLRKWEELLSAEDRTLTAANLKAAVIETGYAVEHARDLASGTNADKSDVSAMARAAASLSSALRNYSCSMMETARSGAGITHADSE